MKTLFACLFIASLGYVSTAMAADDHAGTSRPNIVFIFTDDHCQQALSAYDDSRMVTPNMDRIAKEGMRFDKCYVTNSICGPSRAVILTGKYSHLNGFMVNGNGAFDGSQQTFAKLVRKSGYQTAMIGKWHLKSTPTGFDHYDVLKGQGPYYNPPMITRGPDRNPVTVKHTGYTTDIITGKAVDWLKNGREQGKPFVLMCQHKAPHRNWMPGPKYLNWLDDVEVPEPETLWDDYSGREAPAARQTMTIARHLNPNDLKLTAKPRGLTPEQLEVWQKAYGPKNKAFEEKRASMTEKEVTKWKYQRYVKDYLRCVKSVDDGIGEILKYLDENGLAENTVVMYSSDQGWYLGEHGWFDKRWMYEESLKTPLLVRWPGVVKAGSVNDRHIVSNLDFAETFLDIAGVKQPADMQGASLVPLLKGESPDNWRKTFYYHYYEFPGAHSVARHQGVTNGRQKLIQYYGPSHKKGEFYDAWEMFDLTKDPNELHSVYGEAAYTETQAALEAEMKKLREQYSVPPLDKGPRVRNSEAVKVQ